MFPRPSSETCAPRKRLHDTLRLYEPRQSITNNRTPRRSGLNSHATTNNTTSDVADATHGIYLNESVYSPTFTDIFGGLWTTTQSSQVLSVLGTYGMRICPDVRYRFLPVLTQSARQMLQRGTGVSNDASNSLSSNAGHYATAMSPGSSNSISGTSSPQYQQLNFSPTFALGGATNALSNGSFASQASSYASPYVTTPVSSSSSTTIVDNNMEIYDQDLSLDSTTFAQRRAAVGLRYSSALSTQSDTHPPDNRNSQQSNAHLFGDTLEIHCDNANHSFDADGAMVTTQHGRDMLVFPQSPGVVPDDSHSSPLPTDSMSKHRHTNDFNAPFLSQSTSDILRHSSPPAMNNNTNMNNAYQPSTPSSQYNHNLLFGGDNDVDPFMDAASIASLSSPSPITGANPMSVFAKTPMQYFGTECTHAALTEIGNPAAMPLFFDLDTHWVDMPGEIGDDDLAVLATMCVIVQATVRNFFTCHATDRVDWCTAGEMACTRTNPRPTISTSSGSNGSSADTDTIIDTIDFCMRRGIKRFVDIATHQPQSVAHCRDEAQLRTQTQVTNPNGATFNDTASISSHSSVATTSSATSCFSFRRNLLGDFANHLDSWSESTHRPIATTTINPIAPQLNHNVANNNLDADHVYSERPVALESQFINRCWQRLPPHERIIYKVGLHIHFPHLIVNADQCMEIRKGVVTNLVRHIALNHKMGRYTRMLMYSLIPDACVTTKRDGKRVAGDLVAFWNALVDSAPMVGAQCRKVFSKKSATCLHCLRRHKLHRNNGANDLHSARKSKRPAPSLVGKCDFCGGRETCDEGSDAVNMPFIHVDGHAHTIAEDDLLDATPNLAASHIGRMVARQPLDCALLQPEEMAGRNRTELPNNVANQTTVKRVPSVMLRFMPVEMSADRLRHYVSQWVRITTVHLRDPSFLHMLQNDHIRFQPPLQYCWCHILNDHFDTATNTPNTFTSSSGVNNSGDNNSLWSHDVSQHTNALDVVNGACVRRLHDQWDGAASQRKASSTARGRSNLSSGHNGGNTHSSGNNALSPPTVGETTAVTPRQRKVLIYEPSIDAIMRAIAQFEYGKHAVHTVERAHGNISSSAALVASSHFRRMLTTSPPSMSQTTAGPTPLQLGPSNNKLICRLWPNAHNILDGRRMVVIKQWRPNRRGRAVDDSCELISSADLLWQAHQQHLNQRPTDGNSLRDMRSKLQAYTGPCIKIVFQSALAISRHCAAEFRENKRCGLRLHHHRVQQGADTISKMSTADQISDLATHSSATPHFLLFPFGMFQACPSVHVCQNKMMHVANISSDMSKLLFDGLL